MFDPFSGLTGTIREIAINLSTGGVELMLSVPVSMLLALWLDRKAERRKYERRLAGLQRRCTDLLLFVTRTIFEKDGYDIEQSKPSSLAFRIWRDYCNEQRCLANLVENLELDFADLMDLKFSECVAEIEPLSNRLGACLGLRSKAIHEMVFSGSETEIPEYHVDWAVGHILRIILCTDQVATATKHRVNGEICRDENVLREKYRRYFECVIPVAIEEIRKERT
jgi:hypothetical protein